MKGSRNSLLLALCAFSITSLDVSAAAITNGDFSTCDYTGWSKDTDGLGDFSTGSDFRIDTPGGECRAAIEVDHWSTPGDLSSTPLNDVWFGNTLFQELDLSADTDSVLQLNISYEVQGNNTSAPDYFLIGLNDGTGSYYNEEGDLGFLKAPTDIVGSARENLTFTLDSSFFNQSGWFLDLQLNVGVDTFTFMPDGFGSTLFVNEVALTEIRPPQSVPEPSSLALLAIGVLSVCGRKALSRS